jgi:hypothetical protein
MLTGGAHVGCAVATFPSSHATAHCNAPHHLHRYTGLVNLGNSCYMNSVLQLLWTLQTAGKQDFELMIYPRSRHGLHPQLNAHNQEFQWLQLKKLRSPVSKGQLRRCRVRPRSYSQRSRPRNTRISSASRRCSRSRRCRSRGEAARRGGACWVPCGRRGGWAP